jgi:hypothetical protein
MRLSALRLPFVPEANLFLEWRCGGGHSSGAEARRENDYLFRHCEERSDEAIQNRAAELDCFASLAMTRGLAPHMAAECLNLFPHRGDPSKAGLRPRRERECVSV